MLVVQVPREIFISRRPYNNQLCIYFAKFQKKCQTLPQQYYSSTQTLGISLY